jgi:hypothetical protein
MVTTIFAAQYTEYLISPGFDPKMLQDTAAKPQHAIRPIDTIQPLTIPPRVIGLFIQHYNQNNHFRQPRPCCNRLCRSHQLYQLPRQRQSSTSPARTAHSGQVLDGVRISELLEQMMAYEVRMI